VTMERPVDLSIILPSYNGGRYVPATLQSLRAALVPSGLSWEVVIVDDGGGDVGDPATSDENVRVIRFSRNLGKGAAVRAGVLQAEGTVCAFTDIDLPFGTQPFVSAWQYIVQDGFHAVLGDRTLSGSRYIKELSVTRRTMSRVFSAFVGRLLTPGYFDTQCGFKAFRGDVAREMYRLCRVNRFAQDLEVVYLLLVNRLDVKRIPVVMEVMHPSTVRPIRDSFRTLWDVVQIQVNRRSGRYASPWLEGLVCEEYERRFGGATALDPGSEAEPARLRTGWT